MSSAIRLLLPRKKRSQMYRRPFSQWEQGGEETETFARPAEIGSTIACFVTVHSRMAGGGLDGQSRTMRSTGRSSYHSDFERRPRSLFSCFSILPNLHLPDFLHDLLEIVACGSCIGRNVSKVNHANMTAAMVDSRDFLSARRGAEIEVLIRSHQDRLRRRWTTTITSGSGRRSTRRSPGTRTGCCCGGSPDGAERIAACWAESRGATQVAFKPMEQTRESRPVPPRMETITAGSFALTARFIVTGRFCRFLIRTATPPVRRSPDHRSRDIGGGSFCSHPTALPRRP